MEERRKGFDECGVRSLADRTILFWGFYVLLSEVAVARTGFEVVVNDMIKSFPRY
jgi:hypothetical protein